MTDHTHEIPPMLHMGQKPQGLTQAQEVRTWALDAASRVSVDWTDYDQPRITAEVIERAEAFERYILHGTDAGMLTPAQVADVLDRTETEAHKAVQLGVLDPVEEREAIETIQIIRQRLDLPGAPVEDEDDTASRQRDLANHEAVLDGRVPEDEESQIDMVRQAADMAMAMTERQAMRSTWRAVFALLDQVEVEANDAVEVGDYTENERKFARDMVATTIDSIRQELHIANGDL